MLADHLFHPDHVVPATALVAAQLELTDQPVTQMLMELLAVACERLVVLAVRYRDARIHVKNALVTRTVKYS